MGESSAEWTGSIKDFQLVMHKARLIMLTVLFMMSNWFFISFALADQSSSVTLKNGLNVTLMVQGKLKRTKPNSIIIVCSENAQKDVEVLQSFASAFLPLEKFTIIDGSLPASSKQPEIITVVYFGSGIASELDSACIKAFPGFRELILFKKQLMLNRSAKANEVLKNQFKTEKDVLGRGYCAPDRAATIFQGETLNWSVQLRFSPDKSPHDEQLACPSAYHWLFGFTGLCTEKGCTPEEVAQIIELLQK